MSHAGPPEPPEPPEPERSDPDRTGSGEPEPPGEQTWSPYPAGWDEPTSSAPPPPRYGEAPPPQQGSPYDASPYGQANPYQQAPYSQSAPANPYAGTARPDRPVFGFGGYAGWLSRVGAYLIDSLLMAAAGLPLWIAYGFIVANTTTVTSPDGGTTSSYDGNAALPVTLALIGGVLVLAVFVWNVCIRQGNTGATVGKSVLAIRLVNSEMQPIGPGWAFLRNLLHIVDELPCACLPLGFLWPLWDERKQTFADKIMSTYVIHSTHPQPPAF